MRTAGIAFILLALTALWAYNTGRLEAILAVVKDPNYKPGKTQSVTGLGTIPLSPATVDITGVIKNAAGGATDWGQTIGDIFGGLLGGLF